MLERGWKRFHWQIRTTHGWYGSRDAPKCSQPDPFAKYLEPVIEYVAPAQTKDKTVEFPPSHTVEKIVHVREIQQALEFLPVVVEHVRLASVQVAQTTVEIPQSHTVEEIAEFPEIQMIEVTQTSDSGGQSASSSKTRTIFV